ncbi:MAG: PilT/PilU family type 4a pilus ATPase [Candidatus Obscuribacterales bacterium]|nr:PilT/PilU family type 4a pilus ATPase [Candidatus Obscuribacterales bacterium]
METAVLGADGTLDTILQRGVESKASDVHLHSGYPILMRIAGKVLPTGSSPLEESTLRPLLLSLLKAEEKVTFEDRKDVDFTYEVPGIGRFRANAFIGQSGINASFRVLAPKASTLEELGLPQGLERFAEFHHGLVLITGPAGSGKSTTLAALVNMINEKHHGAHILTLEDPIEILHPNKNCIVNQRQVLVHTNSYERAMRAALREDPDVIVIGEMRDAETISLALTASETGHLVMASMHTTDAVKSISRIIDSFHPDKQSQVRTMLSESLQGVFSQVLLPTADGEGRVLGYEILFVSPAIGNMIKEKKTFQIPGIMQLGRSQGMMTLGQSIGELVRSGKVTREVAKKYTDEAFF